MTPGALAVGAAVATSSKGLAFWFKLMGAADAPGAAEVIAEWAQYEREMPPDVFAAWCQASGGLERGGSTDLPYFSLSHFVFPAAAQIEPFL